VENVFAKTSFYLLEEKLICEKLKAPKWITLLSKWWNRYCLLSIYIKQTVCMYLHPSFTRKPPDQSPPNFALTSTPTWGKVLNTSMTLLTQPPIPGVPHTPKPKQITGEKTLLYKICIKFFPGSSGLLLACVKYCIGKHHSFKNNILNGLILRPLHKNRIELNRIMFISIVIL